MNDFGFVLGIIVICGGLILFGTFIKERAIQMQCAKRGHYVINDTVAIRCSVEKNYLLQKSTTLGERSE